MDLIAEGRIAENFIELSLNSSHLQQVRVYGDASRVKDLHGRMIVRAEK